MSRQLHVANSIHRRSFSSASDICGVTRCRPRAPAIPQLGGRSRVGGYSTKSLSSMGGNRRISCGGGYQIGGQSCGNIYYGGPRNCIDLRNYAGICRNDHFHGVNINEHLLKPLCVGVDPEIQKIRIQEREQMKSLNTQFACFINKVRSLEQKNKMLVTKWNLLQEQRPPSERDLRPLFENSISGLRKHLDFLQSERAKMGPQLRNTQQCVEEFKCKYEEIINQRTAAENDFVLLKKQTKQKLQAVSCQFLGTGLKILHILEKQTVCEGKDVDCSFMNKKELEAKVTALQLEIEFLRCIYDEELSLLDQQSQCETSVVVEMDNSRGLDMNCILQNIDSWYQSIVQGSKEEVNALYRSRFQELQNQRRQINDDLKMNKRQVAELSRITQRLLCDLEKARKQVTGFQSALFDTEHRGDCTLKDAQEKLDGLHRALHKSKDELTCMLRNYQELLNDKLALDIEIATYKSLLEGEENRLISGNLVNAAVVPNPSKVADACGGEPGYGSLSRGFSSRNGKHNPGGPGMGQNHGNVDCYPVGYASRSVGKQCIPGDEEFSRSGGYNSTSSSNASRSAQRPRGTNCGTGGYIATDTARYQGGHPSTGNVPHACYLHGNSGTSFFTGNKI